MSFSVFHSQVYVPPSSSHPMKEYRTSNWINFAALMGLDGEYINVVRIKSAREKEIIAQIKADRNYYMHSFAQTEKYAIFLGHPAYFDLPTLIMTTEPIKALRWDNQAPTYVYVVNLKTGM